MGAALHSRDFTARLNRSKSLPTAVMVKARGITGRTPSFSTTTTRPQPKQQRVSTIKMVLDDFISLFYDSLTPALQEVLIYVKDGAKVH